MIYRIIAGRVVNFVDMEREEGYDSIRVGGLHSKLDKLIVTNLRHECEIHSQCFFWSKLKIFKLNLSTRNGSSMELKWYFARFSKLKWN